MRILLAAFFTLFSIVCHAQTISVVATPPLSEVRAESYGMSQERLSLIDNMLAEQIEDNRTPGAAALIARHGKIIYHKAFGMADNQSGRELQQDDIFRIASQQTKAITCTAVMMLWEECYFRLDDPISAYLPIFGEAHRYLTLLMTMIRRTRLFPQKIRLQSVI